MEFSGEYQMGYSRTNSLQSIHSTKSNNCQSLAHKNKLHGCNAHYLSVPKAEAADTWSANSVENDYLNETPNLLISFLYSLLAMILFLPIGCLAFRNVNQIRIHLAKGHKGNALRYSSYARHLSHASCVVGCIFWSIVTLILIVQYVILKNPKERFG